MALFKVECDFSSITILRFGGFKMINGSFSPSFYFFHGTFKDLGNQLPQNILNIKSSIAFLSLLRALFYFLAPTPPLKSRNTLCQARVNTFNQTLNQKSISLSEAQPPTPLPLTPYNPSIKYIPY